MAKMRFKTALSKPPAWHIVNSIPCNEKMSAKSTDIASFTCLNSAKFQKNLINISDFALHLMRIRRILLARLCVFVRTILVSHVCFLSSMPRWLLGHLFCGRNKENDVT